MLEMEPYSLRSVVNLNGHVPLNFFMKIVWFLIKKQEIELWALGFKSMRKASEIVRQNGILPSLNTPVETGREMQT